MRPSRSLAPLPLVQRTDPFLLYSFAPAAPRARAAPIPPQGHVRPPHAPAAVERVRDAAQPPERRVVARLPADGSSVRFLLSLLLGLPSLLVADVLLQRSASLISPPHRTTTPLSSTLSGPSPSSSGPGSSSNPTLSSLARTRADAATPDPPSIRWTELLAHFRGVQKRRQAAASPARAVGAPAAAAQGAAPPGAAAGDSVSPRADVDGGGAGGAGAAGGGSSAGSRLVGTAAAGRRRPTGQAHGSASGSGFVRAADTASVGSSSVQSGRGGGSGGGGRVGGSAGGGPGAAGLRALSPPLVGTAGGKRRMQGGLAGGGTAGGGAGAGAGSRRM